MVFWIFNSSPQIPIPLLGEGRGGAGQCRKLGEPTEVWHSAMHVAGTGQAFSSGGDTA